MAVVDEVAEVVRRAEAARRREEADDLVAPRAGERMLHHRHQLDVRVAHLAHVRHQRVGQLAVGQEPVALFRARAATTRGAPRRSTSAARASRRATARSRIQSSSLHSYAPSVQMTEAVLGGTSKSPRVRIGLVEQVAAARADLELVAAAVGQLGNEDLPHA